MSQKNKLNNQDRGDNLCDRRGNTLGVKAMLIMLKILRVNRTCEFVWAVTLFYMLFDHVARRRASYYIRHRFPDDNWLQHWYHIWALFTSQGQALVEAAAVRSGQITTEEIGRDKVEEVVKNPQGMILLCSHFGQWQGMMRVICLTNRPVHILVRPDRNVNVDKFMAAKEIQTKIHVISTESGMGGLLDVYDALMNGDTVCMMGDRCRENDSVELDFLGEKAHFPVAAFLMSARTGSPVIPVFSHRASRHKRMIVHFYEPIYVSGTGGRTRERLLPEVEKYVRTLENMVKQSPFEYYLYENIWNTEEGVK